jgi:hypothetical protein
VEIGSPGANTVPRLASQILELGGQLTKQHELEVGRLRVVISNLTGENALLQAQLNMARSEMARERTNFSRERTRPEFLSSEHSLQPAVQSEVEDVPAPAEDAVETEEHHPWCLEAEKSFDIRPQVSQLVDLYVPGMSRQAAVPLPRKGISSVFGPGFHVHDESSIDSPEFLEGTDGVPLPIPEPRLLKAKTTGQLPTLSRVGISSGAIVSRSDVWDLTRCCTSSDVRDLSMQDMTMQAPTCSAESNDKHIVQEEQDKDERNAILLRRLQEEFSKSDQCTVTSTDF